MILVVFLTNAREIRLDVHALDVQDADLRVEDEVLSVSCSCSWPVGVRDVTPGSDSGGIGSAGHRPVPTKG